LNVKVNSRVKELESTFTAAVSDTGSAQNYDNSFYLIDIK